MSGDSRKIAKLRDRLNAALRSDRPDKALALYDQLEELEPSEPRWPHRRGDLLRREGDTARAVQSFERAVDGYAALGFVARAAALAKLVVSLDPTRAEVLERVDPDTARRMHREARGASADRLPIERSAPRLLVDSEAPEDEIRFLDVDDVDDDAIELDLSDLELSDGAPIELDATEIEFVDAPRTRTSEDLSLLPSTPLFAEVPPQALRTMLGAADLVECAPTEALVRVGSAADALFILCEGHVEVRARNLPPVRLGEGDVIGESCLLDHVDRGADVIAVDAVTALRIPKTVLDSLVSEHPKMGDVLLELLTRRLIANFVRTSPIFAGFEPATRAEIARMFEVRRTEEGTVLCQRGKKSDGLYVVLLGQLEVTSDAATDTIGPGEVFGERSLLEHTPSTFDARASSDLLLLRLPRGQFATLAASFPPVLAYLATLSESPHGVAH